MPAKKAPAKPKAPAAKSKASTSAAGKRPLNAYMKAVEKARKSKAASFVYTSAAGVTKTYERAKASTGLMVYKAKGKK